jgi:hypothetical protein
MEIQQNHVRVRAGDRGQGGFAVQRGLDMIPTVDEMLLEDVEEPRLVIDDEDPRRGRHRGRPAST